MEAHNSSIEAWKRARTQRKILSVIRSYEVIALWGQITMYQANEARSLYGRLGIEPPEFMKEVFELFDEEES